MDTRNPMVKRSFLLKFSCDLDKTVSSGEMALLLLERCVADVKGNVFLAALLLIKAPSDAKPFLKPSRRSTKLFHAVQGAEKSLDSIFSIHAERSARLGKKRLMRT